MYERNLPAVKAFLEARERGAIMPEPKLNDAALRPLYRALLKIRGAVDGLLRDYTYLNECKQGAIEALILAEKVYDTTPDVPVLAEHPYGTVASCSTGYCNCAAKDVEIAILRQQLAESAPAEQPRVCPQCGGAGTCSDLDTEPDDCGMCGGAGKVAPEEQPPSYVLVDEIRKALRNGGPLADAVYAAIALAESVTDVGPGGWWCESCKMYHSQSQRRCSVLPVESPADRIISRAEAEDGCQVSVGGLVGDLHSPSGAMTLEQAREKASRLCRPARMGLCFEDVTEEFIRIDYAAERRALEALQHAILHDDTDGDTLAWIERRLEELKHAG
jgi:hypothetical protein